MGKNYITHTIQMCSNPSKLQDHQTNRWHEHWIISIIQYIQYMSIILSFFPLLCHKKKKSKIFLTSNYLQIRKKPVIFIARASELFFSQQKYYLYNIQ